MEADIKVSCDCGSLEGVIKGASPKTGGRVVCYCTDCQAFAEYLGKSNDVLDAHGATDIYQTLPARFEITRGAQNLACVKVTENGILRWYAACCRTPIGNTLGSRNFSFVGFITHSFKETTNGQSIAAATGPSLGAVHIKDAWGDVGDVAAAPIPKLTVKIAMRALGARFCGDHKKTPFFNGDNQPVAKPHTLLTEERAAIDARLEQRS